MLFFTKSASDANLSAMAQEHAKRVASVVQERHFGELCAGEVLSIRENTDRLKHWQYAYGQRIKGTLSGRQHSKSLPSFKRRISVPTARDDRLKVHTLPLPSSLCLFIEPVFRSPLHFPSLTSCRTLQSLSARGSKSLFLPPTPR